MRVSVITPTADRPVGFALCEQWMARQTRQPDEWIVADGGSVPVTCTRGQVHLHEAAPRGPQNFLANLRRGLQRVTGDVVVVAEDDDHYKPKHIATLLSQLDAPGIWAAGDDLQQYYNLPYRSWRTFNNRGASLCQTAFRRELIPLLLDVIGRCVKASSYGVDGRFWAEIPREAQSLQRSQAVVGIKGLPGQKGLGIGHRPTGDGWHRDPRGEQLRAWVGEDAAVYEGLRS